MLHEAIDIDQRFLSLERRSMYLTDIVNRQDVKSREINAVLG